MLLRNVIAAFLLLAGTAHAQINGGGGPSGGSGGSCNTLGGVISGTCGATTITSQTGTGTKFVVDTNPTLVGPTLGAATATSINGNTLTTGAWTLTGVAGKTLTFNNSLTLAGTDASTLNIGGGGTLGTAAFQNTGTSGANVPLLNGANTYSGASTFNSTFAHTGATLSMAAGTLAMAGAAANPTFGANGEGAEWLTSANGLLLAGQGSSFDLVLLNKNLGTIMTVATGTTSPQFANLSTGTNADVVCLKSDGTLLIQAAASCTISSVRFKNMKPQFDPTSAASLNAALALRPVAFTMKVDRKHPNPDNNFAKPQIGLTAENVAEVMPLCAIYEQDGKTPKAYREGCVIAQLVGALHEQQKQINELRHARRQ